MLYVIASRDTARNFIFIPVTKNEVSGEGFTYNICNLCQIIKLKLFFIVNECNVSSVQEKKLV